MIIVDANTVKFAATFSEPTQDADGTPLNDLSHSTIYVKVGTNPPASAASIPATAPTGGGTVNTSILVNAPAGAKTPIDVWVTDSDTLGNESAPSNHVTMTVDRVLPNAPTGFMLA